MDVPDLRFHISDGPNEPGVCVFAGGHFVV